LTKPLRVVWRQTATDDLYRLYDWIADRADPDTAFDRGSRLRIFKMASDMCHDKFALRLIGNKMDGSAGVCCASA
jgi:hypothetical protein